MTIVIQAAMMAAPPIAQRLKVTTYVREVLAPLRILVLHVLLGSLQTARNRAVNRFAVMA